MQQEGVRSIELVLASPANIGVNPITLFVFGHRLADQIDTGIKAGRHSPRNLEAQAGQEPDHVPPGFPVAKLRQDERPQGYDSAWTISRQNASPHETDDNPVEFQTPFRKAQLATEALGTHINFATVGMVKVSPVVLEVLGFFFG